MTDALTDLVLVAERDVWGREVTYTPVGGQPTDTLPDGSALRAIWQAPKPGLSPAAPGYDNPDPRLDFRAADLVALEITPAKGDLITFDVLGSSRTYRVIKADPTDEGSVLLYLAGRP